MIIKCTYTLVCVYTLNDNQRNFVFFFLLHYFWINHSALRFRQIIRLESSYNVQRCKSIIIIPKHSTSTERRNYSKLKIRGTHKFDFWLQSCNRLSYLMLLIQLIVSLRFWKLGTCLLLALCYLSCVGSLWLRYFKIGRRMSFDFKTRNSFKSMPNFVPKSIER